VKALLLNNSENLVQRLFRRGRNNLLTRKIIAKMWGLVDVDNFIAFKGLSGGNNKIDCENFQ
jgi:hypothetical protein